MITMKQVVLGLMIAAGVLAVGVSGVRAAEGDFCQAPGMVPGHRDAQGNCVFDETDSTMCQPGNHYDANQKACVSDKWGEFCTIELGSAIVRGKVNARGTCIAEDLSPGAPCTIDNVAGKLDASRRCVVPEDANGTNTNTNDTGSGGPNNDQGNGGAKQPNQNGGPSIGLINPLGASNCSQNQTCLIDFLLKILDFVIRIGTIVVIVMLVYIGFNYVMAQGNPGALGKVHDQLLWTIIGALILLGSKAIAIGIQATVQAISVGN